MKKIRGIVPPLVTPLHDDDHLDVEGLSRLIEHVIDGGVHALFVLGTTGEGPSLSVKMKREMVRCSCEIVNGRLPVLVAVTDTSFSETIRLSDYAAEHGAEALVVAAPYYFPPAAPELVEYFEHLAPRAPLPFFIYNMPAMTKVDISPETLFVLAEMPNAAGYKDSSGNMIDFHQVLQTLGGRDDFSLMVGPEELLAEATLFGGDGGVAGGANLNPRLYVTIFEAAVKGDMDTVRSSQKEIYRLRQIYGLGHYKSSIIKGIKGALAELGICDDTMAQPFHSFNMGEDREKLRATMRATGLLQ